MSEYYIIEIGVIIVAIFAAFLKKRSGRFMGVFILCLMNFALLYFGLRLAVRNINMPKSAITDVAQQAWGDGAMACQNMVDRYIPTLLLVNICLSFLAVYPIRTTSDRMKQEQVNEGSSLS